ncbi:MAG: hypothetical protein CVV27_00455 [Candidatus Melainabacteria bacterium HGW-Melainabacteria-1]|nr:MAG: hypothetical protein CVV27_00455 [Candidatus Melainabacteria bacterium HGW-Melainabacteria-1]
MNDNLPDLGLGSERVAGPPAFGMPDQLPASLDLPELAQQSHAVRMLAHALFSDQLSHAYLFKGPVPLGLSLALGLAQAIFCPQRGCNRCHVCQVVAAGQYPDLHLIRGEGEGQHPTLKLAQIKHLISQVALPPVQSSHQLFILLQAENLNKESSNALLKTLEEPASNTIIILLTPLLERILPTIRSRAQILPLNAPMPSSESLLAGTEAGKFWQWETLEAIQSAAQLAQLQTQLESLTPAELGLQLQVFQRGCWRKIQSFIVAKRSSAGLRRAYAYLGLFETALAQLGANASPKLVSTSLAQKFLALRKQR